MASGVIFSAEQYYLWRLQRYVNVFCPCSTLLNIAFVHNAVLIHTKRREPTCKNSRTFDPNTRKMVSYPDSWQNSKNIFPNNCKMSPASISEIHEEIPQLVTQIVVVLSQVRFFVHHTVQGASFIPIVKRKASWHLLRTLLAAATRSYVLASSYMILTRNWPSISSWASLLKTKWGHHSFATATLTAQVFVEHAPSSGSCCCFFPFCCCLWC